MASCLESEKELKCPICFEAYNTPKKLPGCSHCFCENCILTFVLNLEKESKLTKEVECPVCKLPSQGPESSAVIHSWVRTLNTNVELKRKIKVEEQGDGECCSQCEYLTKSVIATKFCLNCQLHFCDKCSETLHSFKMLSKHALISINRSKWLHGQALELLSNFVTCFYHPNTQVEFYCEDDKTLSCTHCSIENHKMCKNVKPVCDMTVAVSDAEAAKLVDLTVKLERHIESVVDVIKSNNNENKEQLEKIGSEFQEIRQKVIKLLDIMEDDLSQAGKAAVKEISIQNQDEIDELDDMKNKLKTVQYLLEHLMSNISPGQVFACIHQANQVLESLEIKVKEKGDARKSNGISLSRKSLLNSLMLVGPNDTSELASISKTVIQTPLPIYRDNPFLRKYNIKKTGQYNISPKDLTKILREKDTLTPTYNNLLFLPDNAILLVDSYYGFCTRVDESRTRFRSCTLLSNYVKREPTNFFSNQRYATLMKNGTIALSVSSENKIFFLSPDDGLKVKGEIACKRTPSGLCGLNNGDIAVAWEDPVAFGIISGQCWLNLGNIHFTKGDSREQTVPYCEKIYFTEDKSGRQFESFRDLAVDEELHHVIQPCYVHGAVYCFDLDSNPIFQYSNTKLEEPGAVTLDGDGNIYVCDSSLACIHILSPQGMGLHILEEGCPEYPLAIGFNKANNTFAVTQNAEEYDTVHFFSLLPK